jgi:hypothetical protein
MTTPGTELWACPAMTLNVRRPHTATRPGGPTCVGNQIPALM